MLGMEELYREVILDHYQSPRGKGLLAEASVTAEGKNPLCGDEVTLFLHVDDGRVANVSWDGHGCSICMASASMLAECVRGQALATVRTMLQSVVRMMSGTPLPDAPEFGDLAVLSGVCKFPVRIKCALLPWTTLQEGLKQP